MLTMAKVVTSERRVQATPAPVDDTMAGPHMSPVGPSVMCLVMTSNVSFVGPVW